MDDLDIKSLLREDDEGDEDDPSGALTLDKEDKM